MPARPDASHTHTPPRPPYAPPLTCPPHALTHTLTHRLSAQPAAEALIHHQQPYQQPHHHQQQHRSAGAVANPVLSDLAAAPATLEPATLEPATSTTSALTPVEAAYSAYLRRIAEAYLAEHPQMAAPEHAAHVARVVRSRALGTPLSFDELMRSAVPAPGEVPNRNSRGQVAEQVRVRACVWKGVEMCFWWGLGG